MKNFLVWVIALLVLTGCATREQQIIAETEAVYSDCMELVNSGEIKNYVGEAACVNRGLEQLVIKYDYPYWDLYYLQASYRNDIARQLDERTLKVSEAKEKMREVDQLVSDQEVQRIEFVARVQTEEQQRLKDMVDLINEMEASAAGNRLAEME